MSAILAKYVRPTNAHGTRIRVSDDDGSQTLPYDFGARDPYAAAVANFLGLTPEDFAAGYVDTSYGPFARVFAPRS